MKRSIGRILFCALAVVAVSLVLSGRSHSALSQQQRAQQSIVIIVNVTPAPLVYAPPQADERSAISARFALRAKGSQGLVDAVAQAGPQQAVRVQAEVTPNPNATLLVTNSQAVTINATAGTTTKIACAYTVTSNAASIASWTIRHGVSADFAGGFPGGDLANDSYLQSATPQPTSTPFVVYPAAWTVMGSSSAIKTYCVDLTLTIPASVAQGAYSTNAVYTLYY